MSIVSLSDLAEAAMQVEGRNGRRIVALVGPPASGKSTAAEALADKLPNSQVVPMDGFHKSNAILKELGLIERKGAANTFDTDAFVALIRQIRDREAVVVPTFDRARDCVVSNGDFLNIDVSNVIVEGNYLLLRYAPWDQLHALWDLTIRLEVADSVVEQRLIQRWLDHDHTLEQAKARVRNNDLPNAQHIKRESIPADILVTDLVL